MGPWPRPARRGISSAWSKSPRFIYFSARVRFSSGWAGQEKPDAAPDQGEHQDDDQGDHRALFALAGLAVGPVVRLIAALEARGVRVVRRTRRAADGRHVDGRQLVGRGGARVGCAERVGRRRAAGRGVRVAHGGVKGRGVDRAVQLLRQSGKNGGFVVHAGLLDGRAAERTEFTRDGQLLAAVLAKHRWVPPLKQYDSIHFSIARGKKVVNLPLRWTVGAGLGSGGADGKKRKPFQRIPASSGAGHGEKYGGNAHCSETETALSLDKPAGQP